MSCHGEVIVDGHVSAVGRAGDVMRRARERELEPHAARPALGGERFMFDVFKIDELLMMLIFL